MGTPVTTGLLPAAPLGTVPMRPQTSDEFDTLQLAPMWEWNHNPDDARWSLSERPGFLRLRPGAAPDLFHARNTLTESMQDASLEVTTQLDTAGLHDGDRAGLSVFERALSGIGVVQSGSAQTLFFTLKGQETQGEALPTGTHVVYLRARVLGDEAAYSYSLDGSKFQPLGSRVVLLFSWWKGTRPALFAYNPKGDSQGAADFDWMRYTALSATAERSQ